MPQCHNSHSGSQLQYQYCKNTTFTDQGSKKETKKETNRQMQQKAKEAKDASKQTRINNEAINITCSTQLNATHATIFTCQSIPTSPDVHIHIS